ncbi:MAG: PASTA domain-containing protein, partial [Thermodesulfobacteriota bacterium]
MLKRILKLAVLFTLVTGGVGVSVYLTFTLLVASGETVVVPDITGQNVAYGLEVLTGLGLDSRVKASDYSSDVPKYHVIRQDPEPGERIKKGRSVSIIISKGKKEVFIPDLREMTTDQARIVLEENGLVIGMLSETHAPDVQAGAVLAQHPAPGVMVVRESAVDLLVGLGQRPAAWVMPDLTGFSLAGAIDRIGKMGLPAGEIRFDAREDAPTDTIVGQSPAPGARVMENNRVDLVINRPDSGEGTRLLQGGGGIRVFR